MSTVVKIKEGVAVSDQHAAKLVAKRLLALKKLPVIEVESDGYRVPGERLHLVVSPGKTEGSFQVEVTEKSPSPEIDLSIPTSEKKGLAKGAKKDSDKLSKLIAEANALYRATVSVESETEGIMEGRKEVKGKAMILLARKVKEIKDSDLWKSTGVSSFHSWITKEKEEGRVEFHILYIHSVISLLEHEVIGPNLEEVGVRKAILLTRAEKNRGEQITEEEVEDAAKTGSKALIKQLGLDGKKGEGQEVTIKAVRNRLDKYVKQTAKIEGKKERDKDLLDLLVYLQEQIERVKAIIKG